MRFGTGTACLSLVLLFWGCNPPDDTPEGSDNELVVTRGEGKDNWWDALPRPAWNVFTKVGESQGQYEIQEVRPGIFGIYEPGQFEEVISYLIVGSERALLFDTGLGIGDMSQVVAEVTKLDPIVVNSHTHYDHVGGNHHFDDVYGTDTEYTRSHAGGQGHGDVAEFVGEGWIWKETPTGFETEDYVSQPFTITKTIEDGEVIDLGDRRLDVILTPGHAPDSLCLLDRENRLLFTGDTFYPATLYAHLEGSSFPDYRKSAERLAALAGDVDHLLPAHNEPLVAADYLIRMREAFETIARSEEGEFVLTDGNREYSFEGFTILTPDPLPEL